MHTIFKYKRMLEIKTHTFKGKTYKIVMGVKLSPLQGGECDAPTNKNKTIRFSKNLHKDPEWQLEVVIHEALHACIWDYSEESIVRLAHDIAKRLYLMGYRSTNSKSDDYKDIHKLIKLYLTESLKDFDESVIDDISDDISRFLWRLGYMKCNEVLS